MTNVFILIATSLVIGMALIVPPFAYPLFKFYRARKVLTCPETHGLAEVTLKARRATLTALVGQPALEVMSCTLWPRRKGCGEHCVADGWPTTK
jgi:hypothetical protein